MCEDHVHLEPHCGLGPMKAIRLPSVDLMNHHVVKIQHVKPKGGGGSGNHEVRLHNVEPHGVGVLHPLNHQASAAHIH